MPVVITPQGGINPTGLPSPGVYLQIQQPGVTPFGGVNSGIVGVVGTASWGPVNQPVPFGSYAQYQQAFGALQNRKFDLGTHVYISYQQGTQLQYRGVRVTDGTDTAATVGLGGQAATAVISTAGTGYVVNEVVTLANGVTIRVLTVTAGVPQTIQIVSAANTAQPANPVPQTSSTGSGLGLTVNLTYTAGVTLSSKYTGSLGNSTRVTIVSGSAAGSYQVTVALPGLPPETFNNIPGSGATFWANLVTAINAGQSGLRGPSNIVVASGTSVVAPILATYTASGGTDGAATITAATLIGANAYPYSGMYALQQQGCKTIWLADADDTTQWSVQAAFGLQIGAYAILTGPSGQTPAAAAAAKQAAGVDTPWAKVMLGDFIYWSDPVNGVSRFICQQPFAGGTYGNLDPSASGLNDQQVGVVTTQRLSTGSAYTPTEIALLNQAGIDFIANPTPDGRNQWVLQLGHNSSSDPSRRQDSYTRMVNYLGASIPQIVGPFIGQKITPTQMANAKASLDGFLLNCAAQGQIGDPLGVGQPFLVEIDSLNNPRGQISLGVEQANVQVSLFPILENFLVNLQAAPALFIAPNSAVA